MSKLTLEQIESLGFNFISKDEENTCYSINKLSSKKNWVDLIVWHPNEERVVISRHVFDLGKYMSKNTITDINKIIQPIFRGKVKTLKELETICQTYKLI